MIISRIQLYSFNYIVQRSAFIAININPSKFSIFPTAFSGVNVFIEMSSPLFGSLPLKLSSSLPLIICSHFFDFAFFLLFASLSLLVYSSDIFAMLSEIWLRIRFLDIAIVSKSKFSFLCAAPNISCFALWRVPVHPNQVYDDAIYHISEKNVAVLFHHQSVLCDQPSSAAVITDAHVHFPYPSILCSLPFSAAAVTESVIKFLRTCELCARPLSAAALTVPVLLFHYSCVSIGQVLFDPIAKINYYMDTPPIRFWKFSLCCHFPRVLMICRVFVQLHSILCYCVPFLRLLILKLLRC